MFEQVAPYVGDPILSLVQDFNNDKRKNKINLSIGYYYNDDGIIPELNCVQLAMNELAEHIKGASLYLPMGGLPSYCSGIQSLLFGAKSESANHDRIATIQTLGGSGALSIGADFLFRHYPTSQVWVSDPTWDNHITIFSSAGFKVNRYPYFDAQTGGVNFDAMIQKISSLPPKSIVLLHPCCHNPTGADLSIEQWDKLIPILKQNELIPFMDIAYQGFGLSVDDDIYAIKALDKAGLCGFVSNSFSKTLSLYGERVGGLSVLCENSESAERVRGQLEFSVRCHYSSPVNTAAQIVSYILNKPELKALWIDELNVMRDRIAKMRHELSQKLNDLLPGYDTHFLIEQKGMFSYTGLTKEQVERLKTEFGVYLVGSGRMCVAGLNNHNVNQVATAFASVLSD